jgi:hypothetical protein
MTAIKPLQGSMNGLDISLLSHTPTEPAVEVDESGDEEAPDGRSTSTGPKKKKKKKAKKKVNSFYLLCC